MPPNKRQERVTTYVRKDGTKVRSHTRSAHWARSRAAWAGAGFAGLSATAIVVEAGFTAVSTLAVVLIAVLTAVAVIAGGYAERNKKTMGRQRARRTAGRSRSRTTSGSRSRSRRTGTGRATNSRRGRR